MDEKKEFKTFAKLAHPDPNIDPAGFIRSLPDEFINRYMTNMVDTPVRKKEIFVNYFHDNISLLLVLEKHLEVFYERKEQ